MEITKTIGRATDNDVTISKSDISAHHAKVTLTDKNEFLVEDLNSTNGTFVNGYRVNKATISITDELRLSESTIIDLYVLFDLKTLRPEERKEDDNDFSDEFNQLKLVWDDYQKTRIHIQTKFQKKTTLIRSTITLAPLFLWELFHFVYINHLDPSKDAESIRFWQDKYIIFSVVGSTLAMYATGSMSIAEELSLLDENFRVKYVCPNPDCRTQLGNVPWQSYHNQGKCFRCGAKYKT